MLDGGRTLESKTTEKISGGALGTGAKCPI
jgi:hypothetical protein